MAPTEGRVARPERQWGCHSGTPCHFIKVQQNNSENDTRPGWHVCSSDPSAQFLCPSQWNMDGIHDPSSWHWNSSSEQCSIPPVITTTLNCPKHLSGLTSHSTHYRSLHRQYFTGLMTQVYQALTEGGWLVIEIAVNLIRLTQHAQMHI